MSEFPFKQTNKYYILIPTITTTSKMAGLQKCSKCKSEQELKYFSINKKGNPYKTCDACRNKRSALKQTDSKTIKDILKLIATATQKLEELICDESVQTDIDTKSTVSSQPEPVDEKYVIVVDCETNGLIKQRGVQPNTYNLDQFPRIVQMSWGLYTDDGTCKEIKDYIIKPDGWAMNGSDRCHGITQARATTEGVDIVDVLKKYQYDIDNHCSRIVCHNVDFDKRVIASELIRVKMKVADVPTCCTMIEAIDYCKLTPKVRGEYKWPKLEELYKKCFNADLENAHNSYYDVANCAKCYFYMQSPRSPCFDPSQKR